MRMQIGGNNGQSSKEGMVIRVSGYVEEGTQVGVCGKNVLTGVDVTVWLTDTGACAENKRRKSIKNLRDSFKMGSVRYKLEVGGMVHFKGCFANRNKPNNYISTWANVLGYNAESASESVMYMKHCFVRLFVPKEGDTYKPFGYVSKFLSKNLVAKDMSELSGQIEQARNDINNCTLLVRYLDSNGQVIGFLGIDANKRYYKEESREYTPSEYGANCIELISAELSKYADVNSVNILVATTWSISREQLLSDTNSKLKYWEWLSSHFFEDTREGDNTYRDFFCREAFGKLSDPSEKQIFMNNINFVGKDNEVVTYDPVLLGGLTYAGQDPAPVQPESSTSKEKEEGRAVESAPQKDVAETTAETVSAPTAETVEHKAQTETEQAPKVTKQADEEVRGEATVPQEQVKLKEVQKPEPIVQEQQSSDDYMDLAATIASGAF